MQKNRSSIRHKGRNPRRNPVHYLTLNIVHSYNMLVNGRSVNDRLANDRLYLFNLIRKRAEWGDRFIWKMYFSWAMELTAASILTASPGRIRLDIVLIVKSGQTFPEMKLLTENPVSKLLECSLFPIVKLVCKYLPADRSIHEFSPRRNICLSFSNNCFLDNRTSNKRFSSDQMWF